MKRDFLNLSDLGEGGIVALAFNGDADRKMCAASGGELPEAASFRRSARALRAGGES